jgi:phosphatidylglycerol:prolipoprotein diacylglycerol transferase
VLPELLKVPGLGLSVTSYGFLLASGLVIGTVLSARFARSDGLPAGAVYRLALWILPFSLVGTKLFLILAHRNRPGGWHEAFSLSDSRGVGGYWGGLLVGIGVAAALVRWMSLPWTRIADASAPGLALGNVLGRVGCFAGGCCWGKPTPSWIGVRFTERAHQLTGVPADSYLVPTQIIEAGANLLIFLVLLKLWRHRTFPGQTIIFYLALYSAERYVVDFWRDDPRGTIFGMSAPQVISALVLTAAIIAYRRGSRTSASLSQTP